MFTEREKQILRALVGCLIQACGRTSSDGKMQFISGFLGYYEEALQLLAELKLATGGSYAYEMDNKHLTEVIGLEEESF